MDKIINIYFIIQNQHLSDIFNPQNCPHFFFASVLGFSTRFFIIFNSIKYFLPFFLRYKKSDSFLESDFRDTIYCGQNCEGARISTSSPTASFSTYVSLHTELKHRFRTVALRPSVRPSNRRDGTKTSLILSLNVK